MANGKAKSLSQDKRLREDIAAVNEVYGKPKRGDSPTILGTIARNFGKKDRYSAVGDAIDRARSRRRDARDGISNVKTRVPHEKDDTILLNAGGYAGGLDMSGRGTMAGELAPKGSMSVREAGEDMYELSKRRRGMQGGGGVASSSYNRKYNQKNK